MFLPAVQPLELFVGDYLLHSGSMVVQYFYLVYMQLVELFVGDVLSDGGMVMLCSPAVQPVELFAVDVLPGGGVVVLCSYLVYSWWSCLLVMF